MHPDKIQTKLVKYFKLVGELPGNQVGKLPNNLPDKLGSPK